VPNAILPPDLVQAPLRRPRARAWDLALLAPRHSPRPPVTEMEVAALVPGPFRRVWPRAGFDAFPRFMQGVLEVRPSADNRQLLWRADADGVEQEWRAELVENAPQRRLAWRHPHGAYPLRELRFDPTSEGARVRLRYASADPEAEAHAIAATWERLNNDFDRLLEHLWPGNGA